MLKYKRCLAFFVLNFFLKNVVGTPTAEQCPLAVALQAPACQHGGSLNAYDTFHPVNCADCTCPEGWTGQDCSLCTEVGSCPAKVNATSGEVMPAKQCSSDSLVPNSVERKVGKSYRCTCGIPGDDISQRYCEMQPRTSFFLALWPDAHLQGQRAVQDAPQGEQGSDWNGRLDIDSYGGQPAANRMPTQHYNYTVPGVWQSTFPNCQWTQDRCAPCPEGSYCPWTETEQCFYLDCGPGEVTCPPDYIQKCPGWTRNSCGICPEDGHRYWQHHCNSLSTPQGPLGARLMCQTSADPQTGAFNCSFSQPHSSTLIGIGLQCRTGSCLYEDAAPPPKPMPSHHQKKFKNQTKVVLGCLALAVMLMVAGTALYMRAYYLDTNPDTGISIGKQQPLVPAVNISRISHSRKHSMSTLGRNGSNLGTMSSIGRSRRNSRATSSPLLEVASSGAIRLQSCDSYSTTPRQRSFRNPRGSEGAGGGLLCHSMGTPPRLPSFMPSSSDVGEDAKETEGGQAERGGAEAGGAELGGAEVGGIEVGGIEEGRAEVGRALGNPTQVGWPGLSPPRHSPPSFGNSSELEPTLEPTISDLSNFSLGSFEVGSIPERPMTDPPSASASMPSSREIRRSSPRIAPISSPRSAPPVLPTIFSPYPLDMSDSNPSPRSFFANPERYLPGLEWNAASEPDKDPLELKDPNADVLKAFLKASVMRDSPVVLSWHNLQCRVSMFDGSAKDVLRGVGGVAGGGVLDPGNSLSRGGSNCTEEQHRSARLSCDSQFSIGSEGQEDSIMKEESVQEGLCVIMGPSGAGKSTLLDVLAGRHIAGSVYGTIQIDGRSVPMNKRESILQSVTGYITQDTCLPGTCTVWEYLHFHAALRLPSTSSPQQRSTKVSRLIALLRLEKVSNSLIGDAFLRGISGGEKRRVVIAAALVNPESVILADEPTTNLDSANAAKVLELLQVIASGGVTVVASLHQPPVEALAQASQVLVLSQRGQPLFSGPAQALRPHLQATLDPHTLTNLTATPGEYDLAQCVELLVEVAVSGSSDVVSGLVACCPATPQPKRRKSRTLSHHLLDHLQVEEDEECADISSSMFPRKYTCGFRRQLYALSGRQLLTLVRHPLLFWLQYGSVLSCALALGGLFYDTGYDTAGIQNRLGVLFFMVVFLALLSLSSLPVWKEERRLFLQEREAGLYFTPAYFSSVLLFDLVPLRMVPPCLFAFLSYWMIGLRPECATCLLAFLAVLVLTNLASTTMCMAVGALTTTAASANVAATFLLMLFVLFGGFLLSRASMSWAARMLGQLSFVSHAFQALAVTEFSDPQAVYVFKAALPSEQLPPLMCHGDYVLNEFGFEQSVFAWDIAAIVCLCLVFGALALAGLLLPKGAGLMHFIKRTGGASLGASQPQQQQQQEEDLDKGEDEAPLLPANNTMAASGSLQECRASSESLVMSKSREDASEGDTLNISLRDWTHPDSGFFRNPGSTAGNTSTPRLFPMDLADADGPPTPVAATRSSRLGPSNLRRNSGPDASLPAPRVPGREGELTAPLLSGESSPPREEVEEDGGAAGESYGTPLPVSVPMGTTSRSSSFSRLSPQGRSSQPLAPVVVSWDKVSYSLRDWRGAAKHILQDVSGVAGASNGGITGLMGPSGAGKSTLLDILSGRITGRGTLKGRVLLGRQEVSSARTQRLVGYVLQDLSLPWFSTVTEYLSFHAALRLPSRLQAHREDAVGRVMTVLGLEEVANNLIGQVGGEGALRGLSGGEKRRVGIAAELLSSPRVLFLDEPTTGLDSATSHAVFALLLRISVSSTLILSVHQPSPHILYSMDRLLIISSLGEQVFSGNTAALSIFVDTALPMPLTPVYPHPVDWVLEILGSSSFAGSTLVKSFAASPLSLDLQRLLTCQAQDRPQRLKVMYSAPVLHQLAQLCRRNLARISRNPSYILLHYLANAFIALALGLIYKNLGYDTWGIQNRLGSLLFILLYLALLSLSSLPVWREERLVFLRERASGVYTTAVYFTITVLFDLLPLRVLPPLLFTLLAYPLIGLQSESWRGPACFSAVLVLTNIASAALSMMVGAGTPSTAVANVTASILQLLQLLFAGFFLSNSERNLISFWIAKLSYGNYAYEALVINEFKGVEGFRFTSYTKPPSYVDVDGTAILKTFGFDVSAMIPDVTAIAVISLVCLAFTYLLLRWKRTM